MKPSSKDPTRRRDPYRGFRFRAKWSGKVVAGLSKMSALKPTSELVDYRAGGDPSTSHKSPGRTKYEAITLERGVTLDPGFDSWASSVWRYGAALGSDVSLPNFRKDLYLERLDEAGQTVVIYKVHRCWVSEYQALPDLDAGVNVVAIQHLKLENEGWERVNLVAVPAKPRRRR